MNTQELRTPDLYYAAYLQANGIELARTERIGPRVYFIFSLEGDDIRDLTTGWYNNQGLVPGNPFAQAIKSLKSLCHSTTY